MDYFKHDYIISDENFFDAKVLCMRCAALIMDKGYIEMPVHNNPTRQVNVVFPHKMSHYRLFPVIAECNAHVSMYHLPMCLDCEKIFEMSEEVKPLIVEQITKAMLDESKWQGYPQIFIDATIGRMAQTKILRKAEPRDLKGE